MKPNLDAPASTVLPTWHYSRTAFVLHWTLALLVTMTTAIGLYMMSPLLLMDRDGVFQRMWFKPWR